MGKLNGTLIPEEVVGSVQIVNIEMGFCEDSLTFCLLSYVATLYSTTI